MKLYRMAPRSTSRISKSLIKYRGFTLIELIIFIVMAGILLPVIIVPFVSSVKGSGTPEMVARAVYLAQQRMEELSKFNYDNPTLNPVALTPYTSIPGHPGYQWQWEIVWVDHQFNPSAIDLGYKRILVRIRNPENHTVEIYSVVTRFP